MKICRKCNTEKDYSEFYKNHRKSDGYNFWCKECMLAYGRGWYHVNKDRHIKNVAKRNKRVFKEMHQFVYKYLDSHPCIDCGETNPIVLDFDHVLGDKIANVSAMIRNRGWAVLKAEMAKCAVRCSNCHRRKTFKELNWMKWRIQLGS